MRLSAMVIEWLARRLLSVAVSRDPDFVVGSRDDPYLCRWFILPRNRVFNIYLHQFWRSDDDRALHDHPWVNCSILIQGAYTEHTIAAGGVNLRTLRNTGDLVFRGPRSAHRVELHDGPCMTLFITGPKLRTWGFHCAEAGWVPWQKFTQPDSPGEIGKGCGSK